jgi:biopolymer transport protein ExbD
VQCDVTVGAPAPPRVTPIDGVPVVTVGATGVALAGQPPLAKIDDLFGALAKLAAAGDPMAPGHARLRLEVDAAAPAETVACALSIAYGAGYWRAELVDGKTRALAWPTPPWWRMRAYDVEAAPPVALLVDGDLLRLAVDGKEQKPAVALADAPAALAKLGKTGTVLLAGGKDARHEQLVAVAATAVAAGLGPVELVLREDVAKIFR